MKRLPSGMEAADLTILSVRSSVQDLVGDAMTMRRTPSSEQTRRSSVLIDGPEKLRWWIVSGARFLSSLYARELGMGVSVNLLTS